MQSSDWSKLISMTAVITGINDDGSLSTTSTIAPGTNVVLMETSAQSLKTAINKVCDAVCVTVRLDYNRFDFVSSVL